MKNSSCAELVCPATIKGAPCHGRLRLDDGSGAAVPVVRAPTDADDILEGVVVCESCSAEYPIIAGVLILVDEVKTYLTRNYSLITSVAAGYIEHPMLRYLQGVGYDLYDMGYTGSLWGNALGLGLYLSAHFDNVADIVGPHPLAETLQAYSKRDFYTQVLDIASPALTASSRVLDIGCNVGGMTWRLAGVCQYVYGLDYSFRVALLARRLLCGQPEPLESYRLHREGARYEQRPLPNVRRDNVEVIVASGLSLPFPDQVVDLAYCANVVDLVGQPEAIVAESLRVLKSEGSALITDPYYWRTEDTSMENWLGTRRSEPSSVALRELLATQCDITASEDILWILRGYDRYLTMWLADCVLARKRAAVAETKSLPSNRHARKRRP